MRLAVVGSRHFELWSTRDLIIHSWQLVLHVLGEPEVIVTGCAKGVDQAARELAKHLTGKKPVGHPQSGLDKPHIETITEAP